MPPVEMGYTVHNIDSAYDPHFLIADVASGFDERAIRIPDSILDLLIPGAPVRPLNTSFDLVEDAYYKIPQNVFATRFAQLLGALRIRQFSVGDGVSMLIFQYYFTENNLLRAMLVVDWAQDVMGDINKLFGAPFYHFEKGLLPGKYPNRYLIDYPQVFIDKTRRAVKEVAIRAFYRGVFYGEDGVGAIGNSTKKVKPWQTPEMESPLAPVENPLLRLEKTTLEKR